MYRFRYTMRYGTGKYNLQAETVMNVKDDMVKMLHALSWDN